MERRVLTAAVAEVAYLRGLMALPIGALFLLVGLGNLSWKPLDSTWVFGGCLALLGVLSWRVRGFYNEVFGRVSPRPQARLRYAGVTVLLALAIIVASVLDVQLDVPVSLFSVSFAVAMLINFALQTGLRRHQVMVWGALLLGGMLPIWDRFDDPASVAWIPIGVATVAAGLLDHRLLVSRHRLDTNADLLDRCGA